MNDPVFRIHAVPLAGEASAHDAACQPEYLENPLKTSSLLAATVFLIARNASAQTPDPLAPTGRWPANRNGKAAAPPIGWNTWGAFFTNMDEEKEMASARVIVDSGLAAKGYRYINLDEGWWEKRREDGRILVRTENFRRRVPVTVPRDSAPSPIGRMRWG